MTKEEWIEKCANHMVSRSEVDKEEALQHAVATYNAFHEDGLGSWDEYKDDPEAAAEEEMYCWEGGE